MSKDEKDLRDGVAAVAALLWVWRGLPARLAATDAVDLANDLITKLARSDGEKEIP